jgi:hypothetical protein
LRSNAPDIARDDRAFEAFQDRGKFPYTKSAFNPNSSHNGQLKQGWENAGVRSMVN